MINAVTVAAVAATTAASTTSIAARSFVGRCSNCRLASVGMSEVIGTSIRNPRRESARAMMKGFSGSGYADA